MKVTDQQLSAFLDAELPEAEMQAIRDLVADDDSLALRLAELAEVNEWVVDHARQIDQQPVPQAIKQLLATDNKVVQLSLWQKCQQQFSQHTALAAGVALCFGLILGQTSEDSQLLPQPHLNTALANVLDHAGSGEMVELSEGINMTPRLSFVSHAGQYCRQYRVQMQTLQNDSIACYGADGWQLSASTYHDASLQNGEYKTASHNALLDSVIDQLIVGQALNQQQERQAIAQSWVAQKP
ncbi:MAG: hypothetical protein NWQ54_24615 [Paraglaciecola sp.]|uniref:anti-sigma factor family protein n=1 Tax=Paraglaciecola sp. TaxID=1920173 RepID=UPI00273F1F41|nr:hypothetical protein [Paraglaciecola sp.]MDP5029301.1 hypothetical protein [Paraglaciecola sp.]MDP5134081.1 hypothetical protein [Paraglaciecola sp.]